MRWEYEAIRMHGEPFEDTERFRALGKQRWELVTIADSVAYFKRPVLESKTEQPPTYQPKRIVGRKVVYECPRQPAVAKEE